MSAGAALIVVGTWVIFQVWGGHALERLGLVAS